MRISIFGTGYVGLATGACFAEIGHDVICADRDDLKVAALRSGNLWFHEPELKELLGKQVKTNKIFFTTDLKDAVHSGDILIIAVGTPNHQDGSPDLEQVINVSQIIAESMTSHKWIVIKSTVPPGTHRKLQHIVQEVLNSRETDVTFDVIPNPEFLSEGTALRDCLKPARIIVGTYSESASRVMHRLYEPFVSAERPFLQMDPTSAELVKYAANAMLATRVSFMNEFAALSEEVGADIDQIRIAMGFDPRIGPDFLRAGLGYGGSCLPKDTKALLKMGDEYNLQMPLIQAVVQRNELQRIHYFKKLKFLTGDLAEKKIAVWGLSFKPLTDDLREAASLDLINSLLAEGAHVTAYDPIATGKAKTLFQEQEAVSFTTNPYKAIEGASALCIITEWPNLYSSDLKKIRSLMKEPLILDGRNIFDPDKMREAGFTYYSVGRP